MILLVNEETKTIGFISDQDNTRKLSEIRKVITLDHGIENFSFYMCGVKINICQEERYTLEDCTTKSDVNGFSSQIMIEISSLLRQPEVALNTDFDPKTSLSSTTIPISRKLKCPTSSNSLISDSLYFNSTSSGSDMLKTQKRFTVAEINNAAGFLTRDWMVFYNNMASKLESDHRFDSWGLQARDGVIDVSWTRRKTDLLAIEVTTRTKELHDLLQQNSTTSKEERQLMRNYDYVQSAQYALDRGYDVFCKGLEEGTKPRSVLEQEFDILFTSLKTAQANLLKVFENRPPVLVPDEKVEDESETAFSQVNVNSLAAEIHARTDDIFEETIE